MLEYTTSAYEHGYSLAIEGLLIPKRFNANAIASLHESAGWIRQASDHPGEALF